MASLRSITTGALVAALAIGTLVPAASAGDYSRHYNGGYYYGGHGYRSHYGYAPSYYGYHSYYDYERDRRRKRRNDIAKAVAIGVGIAILGAALSNGHRRWR